MSQDASAAEAIVYNKPRIATRAQLRYRGLVSPTVFRHGRYRFYFFSREEERMHVHVHTPDGEAKFWLEPRIELAKSWGMPNSQIREALRLVKEHADEIQEAWNEHFGG